MLARKGGEKTDGLTQKEIVEGVKNMLEGLDISIRRVEEIKKPPFKPFYRIIISGIRDMNIFNKEINFDHTEKAAKLKLLLTTYKEDHYKPGELERKLVSVLGNKQMTKNELARELKRSPIGRFRKHIKRFEEEGIIKSKTVNGNLKLYYIDDYANKR